MLPPEEAFLAAHEATRVSSITAWGRRGALEEYRARRHLGDPALLTLASGALERSLRAVVRETDPFPAMIWYGGAKDVDRGYRFKGTLSDYCTYVLVARSKEVAPKMRGWVSTPTLNADGRRTNDSTTAVCALNLDCDGRGEWGNLLDYLRSLGVAHFAYQSGGWSPSTPKWHVLLPLTRPFDTSTPARRVEWKRAYEAARIALGSIAGLTGEGFDPRVSTPCAPVFLSERRLDADPPRVVLFQPGATLDITALAEALPPIPIAHAMGGDRRVETEESEPLDDDKLEEVASSLAAVTSDVPGSRRDLYLSLSGAMLDRGVPPDDVVAIVEAVSARYPRRHEDLHRDNVHSAETTVRRWEEGAPVTQIGTLQDLWPSVAEVLDKVLPSRGDEAAAYALEAMREHRARRVPQPHRRHEEGDLPPPPPPPPEEGAGDDPPPPPPEEGGGDKVRERSRRPTDPLARRIDEIAAACVNHSDAEVSLGACFLRRGARGEPLIAPDDPDAIRDYGLDAAVEVACRLAGRRLPKSTPWLSVLSVLTSSITSSGSRDFLQSEERVRAAEDAFRQGQAARVLGFRRRDEKSEEDLKCWREKMRSIRG